MASEPSTCVWARVRSMGRRGDEREGRWKILGQADVD